MIEAITHRGPDYQNSWIDGDNGIALGHARLSILDRSSAGHQPMCAASGRYILIYNGEIYNHLLLRETLEKNGQAPKWRGESDTETLLATIEAWGIEKSLQIWDGMFALALWDREQKKLVLARDRIGEKPLYYGWQKQGNQSTFLFGSELKALCIHPAFEGKINRNALALFLRHNYISAPHSIYDNIYKLPAASILTISLGQPQPLIKKYWSALEMAEEKVKARTNKTWNATESITELDSLLRSAISQRMLADVPLGAFLSGGIDSSLVVALMQSQSARPVKTFSIGFGEQAYNEAEYAKAVALHLGTDHTELYVTPQQAMDVIPLLPTIYDEPFADSSQIPTYLVSKLAREHVKVALSGDAGDELFSGYRRYVMASNLWRYISAVPVPLRKLAAQFITSLSPQTWSNLGQLLPTRRFKHHFGDKLHKGAKVLADRSIDRLYLSLMSHWDEPEAIVSNAHEPATMLRGDTPDLGALGPIERMMALDMTNYMPDDCLVKVDRAAMALGLETRVPLLDRRVVEFAWSLPLDLKQRNGVGKWILRQVLYQYVPQTLIDRPKMGFGVPIDSWLRGPLRNWSENLLDSTRLRQEGFLNPEPIREKWQEHLSGQRNWAYLLWDILMFQAWLENRTGK